MSLRVMDAMTSMQRGKMRVVLALLGFFISIATAQNTPSNLTAASTFYFDKTQTQFSVNVANDSNDVFIYFASPAYSWVGVGFGPKMEGSLMFIMYSNSKNNNVTISPRIGAKGAEPSFNSSIDLSILPGTTLNNDTMLVLNARCANCRSYFDPKATAQPMIYAFGSGQNIQSDSPSANLARHFGYGSFTMNMLAATGPGGVPANSSAPNGVEMKGDLVRDHDRAKLPHAVLGCLALFVIWPLNIIIVAVFKNIKIHVAVSAVIMVLFIISFALGGVVSGQYNRSKAFNSPHQIVALIAILPLLLTAILPALTRLTTRLRSLHTPLVCTSFILLLVTGGLGLNLASQTRQIQLIYSAVSIAIFVFLLTLHSCIRKRGSAYARAHNRRGTSSNDDDYDMPSHGSVMLAKMDETRSISASSLGHPPPPYAQYYAATGPGGADNAQPGTEGQVPGHSRNSSRTRQYGGGTMPGPQYLLNMHPGVPVQVSRM